MLFKMHDYNRISIISYLEKTQFLCAILKLVRRNRYLFCWDGNRIAPLFSKNITLKHAKESTSIIALENSTKNLWF